jgi:hypothetical protein
VVRIQNRGLSVTMNDDDWEKMTKEGWSSFGTHVDMRAELEFSGEDDCGLPLWERPVKKTKLYKEIEQALGGLYIPGLESASPVIQKIQKLFADEMAPEPPDQPEPVSREELVHVFNSVLPIDGNTNYLINRLIRDYDITIRKGDANENHDKT